jgi:hypothetical protein
MDGTCGDEQDDAEYRAGPRKIMQNKDHNQQQGKVSLGHASAKITGHTVLETWSSTTRGAQRPENWHARQDGRVEGEHADNKKVWKMNSCHCTNPDEGFKFWNMYTRGCRFHMLLHLHNHMCSFGGLDQFKYLGFVPC